MFRHRWIREDDYEQLRAERDWAAKQTGIKQLEIDALRERLIDAEAAKRSAQTHRDVLISRANALEIDNATLRNKLTGLPTVAPVIEKGRGLTAAGIGAGVDLFEDVGDEKARELREGGLLHDENSAPVVQPSAADITRGIQ